MGVLFPLIIIFSHQNYIFVHSVCVCVVMLVDGKISLVIFGWFGDGFCSTVSSVSSL